MGSSSVLGVLAFLLALGILIWSRRTAARLRKALADQRTEQERKAEEWRQRDQALKGEIDNLSRFRGIADVDAAAVEIRRLAQEERESAQGEIAALKSAAAQEAATELAKVQDVVRAMRAEAKAALEAATGHASRVVSEAETRAQEIAGKAYDAVKNVEVYKATAEAMKHLIEGYGDAYIVPSHSLLDDLAQDFSHTDAGQQLKAARDRSRLMVRNETAATCDYVEQNRRETAIRFVIDAFNGKVDSILSRVKSDNAGTLAQEIRDASTVVNYNGKAFREARVTEGYLDARLEELKWAAIVQELKLQEREEQRRMKEQIREEQKAQREFERAMREAAKEEELLKKAMEKVRGQVEQATAEQRAKYEGQLRELGNRLAAAEEKNQRALSMAQQTRSGHVYIISNIGSFGDDVYKIGLTRRLEPLDRIRELGDSSVPFEFDVHAMLASEDAPALEAGLHRRFVLAQVNKVNHRKEFFRMPLRELREEVERLGLSGKWTMTAEAREYYETRAIEKAIKDDPQRRDEWTERQLRLDVGKWEAEESVESGSSAEE